MTATCEQIDAVYAMVERYADDLVLVTSADGLDAVLAGSGPIGSLLGAEGGHCIDNSLGVLRTFFRLGRALPDAHPQREHRLGGLGHRRAAARRA